MRLDLGEDVFSDIVFANSFEIFNLVDRHKIGIVRREDWISFYEVLKASGKLEDQILTLLENTGKDGVKILKAK